MLPKLPVVLSDYSSHNGHYQWYWRDAEHLNIFNVYDFLYFPQFVLHLGLARSHHHLAHSYVLNSCKRLHKDWNDEWICSFGHDCKLHCWTLTTMTWQKLIISRDFKSFKTSSIQKSITFNFVHFEEDQIVMSNIYFSWKKHGWPHLRGLSP